MPTIRIPAGTVAEIKQGMSDALVSIGFVLDENDSTKLYWNKDLEKNVYLKFDSTTNDNITLYNYNGSSKILALLPVNVVSVGVRIDYRTFGNSILLGIQLASANFAIQVGFIAPVSETDVWYYPWYAQYGHIYDPITRASYIAFNTASGYICHITGGATESAIQISKPYDTDRFVDSFYFVTVHPATNAGGIYTAYVGDKKLLVWNYTNTNAGTKAHLAFDITNET